jgi:hypothetical protein
MWLVKYLNCGNDSDRESPSLPLRRFRLTEERKHTQTQLRVPRAPVNPMPNTLDRDYIATEQTNELATLNRSLLHLARGVLVW